VLSSLAGAVAMVAWHPDSFADRRAARGRQITTGDLILSRLLRAPRES